MNTHQPKFHEYEAIGCSFLPYVSRDDFFASSNSFNLFVAAAASSVFRCKTYNFKQKVVGDNHFSLSGGGGAQKTDHFLPLI